MGHRAREGDGDSQDDRQEVLIEESIGLIIFTDTDQCRVALGQWVAPFTGAIVTDPGKLDIDHLVPLANAYRSGDHAWDADRKRAYANELSNPAHLVAVTASANRSKGARCRFSGTIDHRYSRSLTHPWEP